MGAYLQNAQEMKDYLEAGFSEYMTVPTILFIVAIVVALSSIACFILAPFYIKGKSRGAKTAAQVISVIDFILGILLIMIFLGVVTLFNIASEGTFAAFDDFLDTLYGFLITPIRFGMSPEAVYGYEAGIGTPILFYALYFVTAGLLGLAAFIVSCIARGKYNGANGLIRGAAAPNGAQQFNPYQPYGQYQQNAQQGYPNQYQPNAQQGYPNQYQQNAQQSYPNQYQQNAQQSYTNQYQQNAQQSYTNQYQQNAQQSYPNQYQQNAQQSYPNQYQPNTQQSYPNQYQPNTQQSYPNQHQPNAQQEYTNQYQQTNVVAPATQSVSQQQSTAFDSTAEKAAEVTLQPASYSDATTVLGDESDYDAGYNTADSASYSDVSHVLSNDDSNDYSGATTVLSDDDYESYYNRTSSTEYVKPDNADFDIEKIEQALQGGTSSSQKSFCANCGSAVNPGTVFCAKCGNKLK